MRIKTTTSELKYALAKFADIVPPNPSLPVLSCVMIKGKADGSGVTIVGTNTDITVQSFIPCVVEIPDTVVVPYRPLSAIAGSAIAGVVGIEAVGDGKVRVFTKSGRNQISTMNPELFPVATRADTEKGVTVPSATLEKILGQVAFATATPDQRRKALEGTLVEISGDEIRAVATNGVVLAVSSHHLDAPVDETLPKILLPLKSNATIRKFLAEGDVKVLLPQDRSYAVFETQDTLVKTKLIDAEYPNYKSVVPDAKSPVFSLSVDSAALRAAVKRTSVLSTFSDVCHVKCDFSGQGIALEAHAEGIGDTQESVEVAEFAGNPSVEHFNGAILVSALASSASGTVSIARMKSTIPVVIDDGKGYKAVVMPVRV